MPVATTRNDYFSRQAEAYHSYRPAYPQALFGYLASIVPAHAVAWDCAAGSGQAAAGLSPYFDTVIATDLSAAQLARADSNPGIGYAVSAAECACIEAGSVDLISVAQALHWFDEAAFFGEARRVLKPGGVIAVWTYNLVTVTSAVDAVVRHLYTEILRSYWPARRRLVETGYAGIDFPFRAMAAPDFEMRADWSLDRLIGYLRSWSAVQRYKDSQGEDPVARIAPALTAAWGGPSTRVLRWPLSMRVGRR